MCAELGPAPAHRPPIEGSLLPEPLGSLTRSLSLSLSLIMISKLAEGECSQPDDHSKARLLGWKCSVAPTQLMAATLGSSGTGGAGMVVMQGRGRPPLPLLQPRSTE